MKRFYQVTDARGSRRIKTVDFPLTLGGREADIIVPGCAQQEVIAYIALAEGHAYVQPETPAVRLFHNGEHLADSAWLKSGDQIQFETTVIVWSVHGDQVQIAVREIAERTDVNAPQVPSAPPTGGRPPLPEAGLATTPDSHRTLKRVAVGLFVLLLACAVFLLLSIPVRVQVEPAPESLSLTGFPPPLRLGERHLLWPGQYRLGAERKGYYPLNETLAVNRDGDRMFAFDLRELPGRVKVEVYPPVAFQLQVDGSAVELFDTVAELTRGKHLLSIHSERYLTAEKQLTVNGFGESQQVQFQLQPAWADIRLDSQPPGAELLVDGNPVGDTPLSVQMLQGQRRIELRKPLYKPVQETFTIIAGRRDDLGVIKLQPADGKVQLQSDPSAVTVQVNGEYRGVTPLELQLASGKMHTLRLAKPGYAVLTKELQLGPEEEQVLALQLAPEYGTVFIQVDPADAEIRIDGKKLKQAGRRLRLSTRVHRVEVSKPGYLSHSTTLTPRASASQTLNILLRTEKQARAQATPGQVRTAAGQSMRLVRPQGEFMLGASRREAGRRANENRRRVQLTRPFYFAEREVTNAEFRAFKPGHSSGSAEGAGLNADAQPVVNISWDDAARYCNWLSKRDGLPAAYREQGGVMRAIRPPTRGYRLPTEVEWAYVARALAHNPPARYPWSGSYPPTVLAGNFADARIADTLADVLPNYDDGYRATAPVGSFAAFPQGFYDLGGNAAEWIHDYYAVYPVAGDKLVKDPYGPVKGDHHVVRGSSWRHGNITELRLSYRDYSRKPRNDLGFRLARYAD